ncbi:MAG: Rieske 2Fe-2S domain-containing protein [Candidatus Velthaea sp.]
MRTLSEALVDAALSIPGLDAAADAIGGLINEAYSLGGGGGKSVKNVLNGTWLGHALHPAITDVPVGAWTAALALDIAGQKQAARTAIGVGLAGALGAAVTGFTDWTDTHGKPRRLGVVHATMNVTTTVLYTLSYVQRRADERRGFGLSVLGYAIAGVSAMYGGALSLDMQIGVNHARGHEPPQDDVDVAALDDVPDGGMRRVDAAGFPVLLVRRAESVRAIAAVCAHQGGPLDEGTLDGDVVTCPWHGSQFCVTDGSIVSGPSAYPQPVFDARVAGGRIRIRLSHD